MLFKGSQAVSDATSHTLHR